MDWLFLTFYLHNCSVRNYRIFGDEYDSFADKVTTVFAVQMFDIVVVDKLDVFADADVFINNGAANDGIFADADMNFLFADALF